MSAAEQRELTGSAKPMLPRPLQLIPVFDRRAVEM
jgi:hypothetical protein